MLDTELALTILPKFETSMRAAADTYFGFAQVFSNGQFGHYAYVFYNHVEDSANGGPASVSQVLAHVAAHELGHLLLRSSAHSTSGLMRERWDQNDLQRAAWGRLYFTPTEAESIRVGALARLRSLANF